MTDKDKIKELTERLEMFCALSNAVSMIVRAPKLRSKEWTDTKVFDLDSYQCEVEGFLKRTFNA